MKKIWRKDRMEKHIEVIGIDHGWSNMKTATQIFTTGVKEITTEPAFYNDVVELDGKYYNWRSALSSTSVIWNSQGRNMKSLLHRKRN